MSLRGPFMQNVEDWSVSRWSFQSMTMETTPPFLFVWSDAASVLCFKQRRGATCALCACSQQRAASFSDSIKRRGPVTRPGWHLPGWISHLLWHLPTALSHTSCVASSVDRCSGTRGTSGIESYDGCMCMRRREEGSFIIVQCVGKNGWKP